LSDFWLGATAFVAPSRRIIQVEMVRFSYSRTGVGRKHYLNEQDVRVLLSRIPSEVWAGLRAVHFNDRGFGCRVLGYVNGGRREIAICALPQRVSLTRFWACRSPREFGARRGRQWPELAVRRFMLYDVFLHELGHLQLVDPKARRPRRRFASETRSQEFADCWRRKLWSSRFDHPDPIHNPPSSKELEQIEADPVPTNVARTT
jgi:hypothetical protein